jgi:hypothetical protein
MRTQTTRSESGSTIVVTIGVVAIILVLLGSAVAYTQHISRLGQRSRQASVAMEIADGHLEVLFTSWRNIYRQTSGNALPTQYFYTSTFNRPFVSGPGNTQAPPLIPLPSPSLFPSESNYTVERYTIQAVEPNIGIDADGWSTVTDFTLKPNPAIGPIDKLQESWFYLASVDITVPTLTGTVTAKIRRIFERKNDTPWSYAIFYNDDLEFNPESNMTITGQIQTNSNLYIASNKLIVRDSGNVNIPPSKVSYGSEYVNGYAPGHPLHRADGNYGSSVSEPQILNGIPIYQEAPLLPFGWSLNLTGTNTNNRTYHELIERRDPDSSVPDEPTVAPLRFFNNAGIRVLIDQSNAIRVFNASGQECRSTSTGNDLKIYNLIMSAIPATNRNLALADAREGVNVRTTNVDISKFTNLTSSGSSPTNHSGFNGVLYIVDTTPPTVNGAPNVVAGAKMGALTVSTTQRAIRLVNGSALPAANTTLGNVAGLTVVSENPIYIQGNYNTNSASNTAVTPPNNRQPAAVIGDAVTVLSNSWNDSLSNAILTSRLASATTINTAIVSGIVPTSGGSYSGGAENFIRLLEDWRNQTFNYQGSMVQLYYSVTANAPLAAVGSTVYKSPSTANFVYDTNFASSFPPGNLTLSSYLQQQRWYQVY